MLTKVKIKDFQSLRKAEIELSPFTVIVGASSSGKSAFLRSLRTLMRNASSTSFVTHGAKKSDISVELDGKEIGLQRGPGLATYRVDSETYPKSNKGVPEEVTKALGGLPVEIEEENLNFSFQFDKPFLLDAPAAKVAKVLGDLTNVNVLHGAVREANRRRLDSLGQLKVRRSDLESAEIELASYRTLPAEKKEYDALQAEWVAITRHWTMLSEFKEHLKEIGLLRGLLQERTHLLQSLPAEVSVNLDKQAADIATLRKLLRDIRHDGASLAEAKKRLQAAEEAVTNCESRHTELLTEAGRCPVCDQEIKT